MDFILTPGEPVLRRAVQADVVVMLDVALYQTPRVFQRQGRSRPDALSFERFVPAFDLSVRLGYGQVLTCLMPEIRMNSLKSLAMNC